MPHESAIKYHKLSTITHNNVVFATIPDTILSEVPTTLQQIVQANTLHAHPMVQMHSTFESTTFLSLLLGVPHVRTSFGSTMSIDQIVETILSIPEVSQDPPTYTLHHPISNDIFIHEHLAIATPSGWKFKAGEVYENHKATWLAISNNNPKVRTQLEVGWCPPQRCNLSPTWFQSNTLSLVEQTAWDTEVQNLWAMNAIQQVDWKWVQKWGLPRVILPVFLVEEPSKFRPIMDARFSNLALLAEWFSCPNILDFCHTLSHKQFWFKADQKAGWQHIHIHPLHSRFFCFIWNKKIFAYTTPAFGDATAPYIFTYMGATFKRVLTARNINFILYIDDLLVAGKDTFEASCSLRSEIISLAISLGVTFATPKCPLPAYKGEALGFQVNTLDGTLSISEKREQKVNKLLHTLLDESVNDQPTPIKQVARLVGLIISCQVLHPQTMWFVAPLIHMFGDDWESTIRLRPTQLSRIFNWIQLIKSHPRRLWVSPPLKRYVSTDATLTQLGATLWVNGPSFLASTNTSAPEATALVRPNARPINIAHFEAVAIPWALNTFLQLLPHKAHIIWAVDNQNVLYGFRSGFARMGYIAHQIDMFMSIVCLHKLWIEFIWVPSAINLEADQFSRYFLPSQEWELHPHYWHQFLAYCKEFSMPLPSVDAFASANNTKCRQYFAQYRDGKAIGNFFFSTLSEQEVYWIFAPFGRILSQVLHKIQDKCVCAWVVLPRWTSRPWWQFRSKAKFQFTFILSSNMPLFVVPTEDLARKPINPQYDVDVWFFDFRVPKIKGNSTQLLHSHESKHTQN